ncbi:zf-PARP-domain-containing protein [Cristinia sonorae]|uniref:Zf-PARP-domain-containing protein n=1 Tax=Cristinia sonorae TaxID=1940300 RepID=A0A8K0UTI2_9AGAR|nr:zf-PARP-domain-containing protein [Cristinia sonorae]
MSDDEGGGKKGGYRLEYASTGRAKCKGPKPCQGSPIEKGQLRVGSLVDFQGNTSFAWRHWGCTTSKIFDNMKKTLSEADELDGFEDLKPADQEKVRKAWEDGHVADEDAPAGAKKAGDDASDDEKPKKGKKAAAEKGGKKKAAESKEPAKGVFKFEYAASGRSKCKECNETIGKGFFRLGNEVDFRGNKSFAWQHFGCTSTTRVAKLVQSYDEPSAVEGFSDLQEGDKERVQRAWEEGAIPEDDKGPGEAIEVAKKKPAPRKKKDDDGEDRPKKRAKKAKDTEDEDEDMDDEEEKPKPKRGAAKKAAAEKPAPKKRAPAKKRAKDESEEGEDFGEELANVSGDDDEDERDAVESEEEEPTKKRKRAPAAKASSSKPAAKPASKTAAKPASKKAAKPSSSRAKKQAVEEEDEDED